MMSILGYIVNFIGILLVIGLILIFMDYVKKNIIKKGMLNEARKIALGLMLIAERTLSTEEGYTRMKFVLDNFYNLLPVQIKFILKEKDIEVFLQEVYDEAKKIISQ